MRKIIYIMLFAVLAQACSQHVADGQAEGFLQLNEIHVTSDVSVEPLGTRAVHDGLQVDIYRGDACLYSYAAADPVLDAPLPLPVGSYRLEAHSPDMLEPQDGTAGVATYSVSHDFEIKLDQTTTLPALQAMRTNVGVSVSYDPGMKETIKDVRCVVASSSGREVTISGFDNATVHYFELPSDKKLTYYIWCKNVDDEEFRSDTKTISVEGPKNHKISVAI